MKLEELMNLTKMVLTYLTLDTSCLMDKGVFDSLEENIRMQLKSFYSYLERIKKGTFNIDSKALEITYFMDIYKGIKEYLTKRGFMPLANSVEYKDFFKSILSIKEAINPLDKEDLKKMDSYMEKLLYILAREHSVLYEFSLDNDKVIKTNLVFSDDEMIPMNTNHIKDYAKDLPENLKRYSRPLKVCYELDLVKNKVLRDGLSKDEVVSRYMNGGFDRLCPGDIKDIKRIKGLSK